MAEITIIIPSYNYAAYIGETIASVARQMLSGDELIIVDDGSTDNTADVVAGFSDDERIRYVYQSNTGVAGARNHGIRLASNEYLYLLDADDQVIDGGLALLRTAASEHPDAAMVIGGHISDDFQGRRREHNQRGVTPDPKKNFVDYVIHKRFTVANGGTALIKKSAAERFPYPENLKVSDDFCVFAWIIANYPCATFPEPVVVVRKHDDSLRNQLPRYEHDVSLLPDMVFDGEKIPKSLLVWKRKFYCNRLLSLFRAYYIAREKDLAKITYRKAIVCDPFNVFKLSYLRKYLYIMLGR